MPNATRRGREATGTFRASRLAPHPEARHHASYVSLALELEPRDVVLSRLQALAVHEAAVLDATAAGPRLHDGEDRVPASPKEARPPAC